MHGLENQNTDRDMMRLKRPDGESNGFGLHMVRGDEGSR